MPTVPRSAFLLVRHQADLEREGAGLTAYLSDLRRRSPSSGGDALQGIWIDEDGVANLPDALGLPDAAGGQRIVRVIEAAGINGVWMVCWLDTTAASVSRVDLLAALLQCFGQDESSATGPARFVPVFAGDAPELVVRAELQRLRARYPAIVLPPIFQNRSDILGPSSGHPHREATTA